MAGPKWAVETHPDSDKIVRAIISGRHSLRDIARQYGITVSAISRYLKGRLLLQAAQVAAQRERYQGEGLLREVEKVMARMQKLYDACHEYLQDPDNPERYDLGPRDHELTVIYQVPGQKKPVRVKENLHRLLLRVLAEENGELLEVHYRHSDPRKLIIDTAATLTKQLELVGKIQGNIKDIVINYTLNETWIRLKTILYRVTEKHPKIREEIIAELEKASDAQSG